MYTIRMQIYASFLPKHFTEEQKKNSTEPSVYSVMSSIVNHHKHIFPISRISREWLEYSLRTLRFFSSMLCLSALFVMSLIIFTIEPETYLLLNYIWCLFFFHFCIFVSDGFSVKRGFILFSCTCFALQRGCTVCNICASVRFISLASTMSFSYTLFIPSVCVCILVDPRQNNPSNTRAFARTPPNMHDQRDEKH